MCLFCYADYYSLFLFPLASIAYDIAFVTESKRNRRRTQPLKSGGSRRGSNKQQTSRATSTTSKVTSAIHNELSIPSAIKVHVSIWYTCTVHWALGRGEGKKPISLGSNQETRVAPYQSV